MPFWACLAWEEAKDQVTFRRLRDAAFYEHKEERLSKAALDALYGTSITESVSRLEQYARCAYAYFLRYGLGLLPRPEHAFEVADMGNLYHEALEEYSKRLLKREDVNWYTISREQSDALLAESIAYTYQTMAKTEVLEEGRDRYILRRMEKTLQQTVHALTEQVRKGSFVPSAFEVDFRQVSDLDALRFQLDEMHTMRLRGKVDRVDLYQDGPSVYVKIVDYKSGAKDIDFAQLYQGLQVQLVLYMDATAEGLKERYPQKEDQPRRHVLLPYRPSAATGRRSYRAGKRAGAFKRIADERCRQCRSACDRGIASRTGRAVGCHSGGDQ